MRKPLLAVAAAVALAAPATAATAPAAPGPQGLDTRFGNCGVITPPLPRNFSGAQRLARAPGGAIVAAGTATLRLKGSVIHPDTFVVTRFSADGVLDTGFGGGDGVVTLKVPRPSGAGDAQLTGLAVDAGGKVVVSGYVQLADPSRSRSLLARYNPDGTLDSSFGSGGIADDALPAANSGEIDDIALAPGGGLFAAGGRDPGGFTVARYRSDGTLDPAFGSGGVATLDPGIGGSHAFVVRVLADGRVLAGGQAGAQYELVRLLPTGMADPSFGNGGVTVESPPAAGAISALAPLGDGRVLAAGTASNINGRDQLALARYGADGHADTGFGRAGFVIDSQAYRPRSLTVASDGKLVASGGSSLGGSGLLRYGADGSRDTGFGAGGALVGFSSFGIQVGDVLLQSDGTALAAIDTGLSFGVERLAVDEPALSATAGQPHACSVRVTTKSLTQLLRRGTGKARNGKLNIALNLRRPGRLRITAVARVGSRRAALGNVTRTDATTGKAVASIFVSSAAAKLLRGASKADIVISAVGTDGGAAVSATRTLKR